MFSHICTITHIYSHNTFIKYFMYPIIRTKKSWISRRCIIKTKNFTSISVWNDGRVIVSIRVRFKNPLYNNVWAMSLVHASLKDRPSFVFAPRTLHSVSSYIKLTIIIIFRLKFTNSFRSKRTHYIYYKNGNVTVMIILYFRHM